MAAATPPDLRKVAIAYDMLKAETSLYEFVKQAWPILEPDTPYVDGMHVRVICQHLEAVSRGQIKDLIINIPPGFAKSLLTSVFWPAWVWGPFGHPEKRWITASYKADLAIRDASKARYLMGTQWFQERWPIQFNPRQDAKEKYENTRLGVREVCSVGSGTGSRADIVLVDDPQSRDQAASDTERKAANDWWNETMWNRVNDLKTGPHVVIQQRLHEDDLTGNLLTRGGYVHLMLPLEFEPERRCKTPLWEDPRTKHGELLWPAKIGREEVEALKTKGSYFYSGQYQQRPAPAAGGIFKRWWFQYWKPKQMELQPVELRMIDGTIRRIHAVDLPDEFDEIVQSWDTAFRILDTADFVAGGVWASKGPRRFLLEQRHGRLEFPEVCDAVKGFAKRYPKLRATYIEDAANGSAIISALRSQMQSVIAVKPEGHKVSRANAISPMCEAGNIYLPHPAVAPWVEHFIEECIVFPNGLHDDQVDQMTQALIKMKNRAVPPPQPATRINPITSDRGWMA